MDTEYDYRRDAIAAGFPYECACGEQYRDPELAHGCRKCCRYLSDEKYFNRQVIDLRTGEEVKAFAGRGRM